MVVHAAFGGSTNLLLHIPAIAFAAGLPRPTVDDWSDVNRQVPRLVDVLPNGPVGHPTVRVFLAGGVPEVMLHLRELGLLDARRADRHRRAAGRRARLVGAVASVAARLRELLRRARRRRSGRRHHAAGRSARERGLTSTVTFPARQPRAGRLGHQEHGHRPERRRCRRRLSQDRPGARLHAASATPSPRSRARRGEPIKPGDVLVLICRGPMGAGMEEIYQITSALKHLPCGKQVARAHRRPVLRRLDRRLHRPRRPRSAGRRPDRQAPRRRLDPDRHRPQSPGRHRRPGRRRRRAVRARSREPACWRRGRRGPTSRPTRDLPADTRLWAALQQAGGGTWGGCVYDVDAITRALERGK